MQQISIEKVQQYLLQLQKNICQQLAEEDGEKDFIVDEWQRPQGGGGLTRVMENGGVIEKGGVNYSYVEGTNMPASPPRIDQSWRDAVLRQWVCHW